MDGYKRVNTDEEHETSNSQSFEMESGDRYTSGCGKFDDFYTKTLFSGDTPIELEWTCYIYAWLSKTLIYEK